MLEHFPLLSSLSVTTSVTTDFTTGEIKRWLDPPENAPHPGSRSPACSGENLSQAADDTHLLLPALAVLAEGYESVKQDKTDKQLRVEGGSQPEPGTRCTGKRAPNIHSI